MNQTGTRGLLCAALLAAGCSDGGAGRIVPAGSPNGTGVTGTTVTDPLPAGAGGGVAAGTTTGSVVATTGGLSGETVGCTPSVAPTSQIPRLTNQQYDRVLRDLLGVTALSAGGDVAPSTVLATDQAGGLTDLGWSAYQSVAEQIAAQVMADPNLKANFMTCTPTADDGGACLRDTIVQFGRRAFRRPLSADEIARFEAVVARGAEITPTGAPEEVAEAVLYMFLISPSFLQRAEITETSDGAGGYTLSSHEIASRLSFMLWGSLPDAELDAAADQGLLGTADQILAQAERMLADPRARDMVTAFHRYYLLMGAGGRWDTAQRDPALFPEFSTDLLPVIAEETLRFFDKVTFTPGSSFADFFLSPTAYVNAQTAPLYGLDPAGFGADLVETTLDASQRPGFLTRAGFLNSYSSYTRTSPILRGAFITKEVLGINIPPPPPGANQAALPDSADLDTNRKQVEAQTAGDDCAGCHHPYVNPPGFVMESFDAIGRWRTTEASGVPLDTVADVTVDDGQPPVTIASPAELMAAIASSPGAMHQYAAKWVSYAYEREADPLDSCTVDELAARMTSDGYTVLNLITDLTQTQSFRTRVVEVVQ